MPRKQKSVPYARGFQVPHQSVITKALGVFDDTSADTVFTESFCQTFDSVPCPKKPWDWLAQYPERGQTYTEYLQLARTLHTPASAHRQSIYLAVLGAIDHTVFDLDSLINYTQRYFQMPVKVIDPFLDVQWLDETKQWTCTMSLSDGKTRSCKLSTRYNDKPKHSQICVTKILDLLRKVVPDDARCLVALTMLDLYDGEDDLFIAGLARGNNRVAVFSLYRYDPHLTFSEANWFDCQVKVGSKSTREIAKRRGALLLRACRLLTHEICHLLGIAHCIFYSCLMNGSGHLEEDFAQPLLECPIDLRKLHACIGFDIQQRYQQLLEFFQLHQFLTETNSIERKLSVVDQLTRSSSSNNATAVVKRKRSSRAIEDEETSQSRAKSLKTE